MYYFPFQKTVIELLNPTSMHRKSCCSHVVSQRCSEKVRNVFSIPDNCSSGGSSPRSSGSAYSYGTKPGVMSFLWLCIFFILDHKFSYVNFLSHKWFFYSWSKILAEKILRFRSCTMTKTSLFCTGQRASRPQRRAGENLVDFNFKKSLFSNTRTQMWALRLPVPLWSPFLAWWWVLWNVSTNILHSCNQAYLL